MWTVIIGKNGTGKTSILQAIALAAAGSAQVNSLAKPVVAQLRDRRESAREQDLEISARFGFSEIARRKDLHPLISKQIPANLTLCSTVKLSPGERNMEASSRYEGKVKVSPGDPLDRARSKALKLWFVAGYGVARALPEVGVPVRLDNPSIERMAPLFDPKVALTSTGFADHFRERPEKARMFARVLKKALFKSKELLPLIENLELRGRAGVGKSQALAGENRFAQRIGSGSLKISATALSHGYQSTISWISDLIGHVVLEADMDRDLDTAEMEGIVLIDELDLYLHPTWQVVLVRALRRTFPRMQFIVTTHSPMVLGDLMPEEILHLDIDPETGNVKPVDVRSDPRLLTGTETYRQFFDVSDIYPDPEMAILRDYRFLAANPFRSDADEKNLATMRRKLEREKIDPRFEPVPRIKP